MPSPASFERASREDLRARFESDRPIHVYGLGDLTDEYFSRSRWWQRGQATIGEIGLPGDPPELIVYGVNAGDPNDALALWADVDHLLPDRYFATGPVGFAAYLSARGRVVEFDAGEHVKMFSKNLSRTLEIAPRNGQVVDSERGFVGRAIDQGDLGAIEALQATHDDPGSFFTPTLLDDGPFYGVFDGDELIAMAGIHVCSTEMDVAAIGCVLVHPERRGLGLGTVVTAAQVRALHDLGIGSIGLNVKADNTTARGIYERLGFVEVHRYEEALLAR
ncbi:MAG: GNAT family N-acetyltransferase [Acidimicrobiales bacterium]